MGRIQLLDSGYGDGADNPPPTFPPGQTPTTPTPTPTIPAPTEPRVPAPTTGGTQGTQPVPGGRTTESGPTTPPPPQPTGMPDGIDPRLAALYQKYGVTPQGRGTGSPDWQYWQNEALHNASGDWDYVLGRLEYDLSGGKTGIGHSPEGPSAGQGQRGGYGGTSVFDDPATAAFERLLNERIGQLQQPYSPPDMQPALDYLRKYFQQLQGPAYTPDQMDLIQTQTLDPLARERDAQRQRILQNFAARGMSPDSGVVQKALLDSDQNFERLRTGAQAQFASGAINTQRQQQQLAAGLGPQIAAIEQNQFNNQEGRLNQAVNLAEVIPNLAWSRLTGSQNIMQQTNPLSALQLMNNFQTQGYNQGNDFSQGLMGILPYLIQLFGGGR